MRNKHISVFLATVLLFLSAFVYGNVPDGTPKDGTNKPGETTGDDKKDGTGKPKECPVCHIILEPAEDNTGNTNGGKGEPE